jgi:predicted secreted protein
MKLAGLILFLALFLASSCTTYYSPGQTRDNSGRLDVTAKKGSAFGIKLPENYSTGYRWFDPIISDQNILAPTGEDYEFPVIPNLMGMIGVGGTRIFLFKALIPGEATITFTDGRSPRVIGRKIVVRVSVH